MEGPQPATLVQALYDIRCNRLIASAAHYPWWTAGTVFLLAVILGWVAPTYLDLLLVLPAFFLVALFGYLVAQWRFAALIRSRQPRCPECKAVVWQLQCGHCGQPLPIFALLYRGWFLAHCPHCQASISDKDGTLLVWCQVCGATTRDPRAHFSRRSVVEIEVSPDLPKPAADCQLRAAGEYQELHQVVDTTYTIIYRVTHDRKSFEKVPIEMFEFVSWVWIGHGVNSLVRANILGSIPVATRRLTTVCLEDDRMPADINQEDYHRVFSGVPRPTRLEPHGSGHRPFGIEK